MLFGENLKITDVCNKRGPEYIVDGRWQKSQITPDRGLGVQCGKSRHASLTNAPSVFIMISGMWVAP